MSNMEKYKSLFKGFYEAAEKYGARDALYVDGMTYVYEELAERSLCWAESIHKANENPYVLTLGYQSYSNYVSMLAALGAGKAYVPLNPNFPKQRLLKTMEIVEAGTLIVAAEGEASLDQLLKEYQGTLVILLCDSDSKAGWEGRYPQHRWLKAGECKYSGAMRQAAPEDPAYVLFTSGSTGEPKGIEISNRNIYNYLRFILAEYPIYTEDRISQIFDPTFDVSVYDMFTGWWSGAAVYSLPRAQRLQLSSFVRDHELTCWCSVPSLANAVRQIRLLEGGGLKTLRQSVFTGEALSMNTARTWKKAAPHSTIINLYGPTEVTIQFAHFQCDDLDKEYPHSMMPIGFVFPSQSGKVMKEDAREAEIGQAGELYVSGSQVSKGYLKNREQTKSSFVKIPESDNLWYRTGDLVEMDEEGCLYYLGRIDDQVQINGYRVELQEIEAVLRRAAKTATAVVIPWPPERKNNPDSVYGFVLSGGKLDKKKINALCKEELPEFTRPADIFPIETVPINASGKLDRKALSKQLSELLS
ncbi:amino acid adenylation domain-containing protein [Desulfobacter latus]|uniref:Amino acid adenylation domain-containing protein n=1 Tax=Desulfobacter latus TaxID=2292 RepID=A0A850SUY2_9BACT|nr:amino acid adenylation domain-containing protein [Desulfobacter latus]NWH04959.1 amino acid adenylation domain-containing protein [Desulfobacter latus]